MPPNFYEGKWAKKATPVQTQILSYGNRKTTQRVDPGANSHREAYLKSKPEGHLGGAGS